MWSHRATQLVGIYIYIYRLLYYMMRGGGIYSVDSSEGFLMAHGAAHTQNLCAHNVRVRRKKKQTTNSTSRI